MSLAAFILAFAFQEAARPCTAEEVRTASIPPQIAWRPAAFEHDVPADQRRWFTAALGPDLSALAAPDFGYAALPMSPYDFAFFAVTGDRMRLYMCRGASCQTGYDGPRRDIAWATTFTQNMPDLVFDRSEVNVFDRGRYRRVCRVTFDIP